VGHVQKIADGPPLVSFPALLRQVDAARRAQHGTLLLPEPAIRR